MRLEAYINKKLYNVAYVGLRISIDLWTKINKVLSRDISC